MEKAEETRLKKIFTEEQLKAFLLKKVKEGALEKYKAQFIKSESKKELLGGFENYLYLDLLSKLSPDDIKAFKKQFASEKKINAKNEIAEEKAKVEKKEMDDKNYKLGVAKEKEIYEKIFNLLNNNIIEKKAMTELYIMDMFHDKNLNPLQRSEYIETQLNKENGFLYVVNWLLSTSKSNSNFMKRKPIYNHLRYYYFGNRDEIIDLWNEYLNAGIEHKDSLNSYTGEY